MATLLGFTRPSDPIKSDDLASKLTTLLGMVISVDITPTDVQVTGSTLTETNRSTVQSALNTYYYNYLESGGLISDNPDMSAKRHNVAVSEYASYTADASISGSIGKLQTPSGTVSGAFAYPNKGTTNSSGVATIYLTDNGLSTGNAVFTTVYEDGIVAMPVGSASNYQVTSVVLSSDKKSIAVTVNQLSSVVLGLVSTTTAASGVVVRAIVMGK